MTDLTAAVERAMQNAKNEYAKHPRQVFNLVLTDCLRAERVYVTSPEQQKALDELRNWCELARQFVDARKIMTPVQVGVLCDAVDRVLALGIPTSDYHTGLLAALHVCEKASNGTHPAALADEIRGMAARAVPSANLSVPEVRESESRAKADDKTDWQIFWTVKDIVDEAHTIDVAGAEIRALFTPSGQAHSSEPLVESTQGPIRPLQAGESPATSLLEKQLADAQKTITNARYLVLHGQSESAERLFKEYWNNWRGQFTTSKEQRT